MTAVVPAATAARATSETAAHRELKRRAIVWAIERGLPLVSQEVRVPRSPYRADVAAASRHPSGPDGLVALFECKQCRADFLRDEADEPELRHTVARQSARLHSLISLVANHRPDLRRGETLFPEFDAYDLRDLRHDTLRSLEREVDQLQRKLTTSVKFSRLRRYHSADLLYLVTEPGIIEDYEVPNGWGWLVRDPVGGLRLCKLPVRASTVPEQRLSWLESIALAGSRATAKALQVPAGTGYASRKLFPPEPL